jgi:hypothetical protein
MNANISEIATESSFHEPAGRIVERLARGTEHFMDDSRRIRQGHIDSGSSPEIRYRTAFRLERIPISRNPGRRGAGSKLGALRYAHDSFGHCFSF